MWVREISTWSLLYLIDLGNDFIWQVLIHLTISIEQYKYEFSIQTQLMNSNNFEFHNWILNTIFNSEYKHYIKQKLINKNLSFIDITTQITLSLQHSWYKNWWITNRNEYEDYNIAPKLKSRLNDLENIFWPYSSSKTCKIKHQH